MVKIANLSCGNERNSKTKYSTATKFAPVCNNDSSYKTMKSFFQKSCCIFKLRCENSWLIGSRLPWQPQKKSGFMVLCVLSIHNYSPNMVTMRCIVFELGSFCCLANQRLCLVTIATRVNRDAFFKTRGHTLRIGIQHALVNLWKSAEI